MMTSSMTVAPTTTVSTALWIKKLPTILLLATLASVGGVKGIQYLHSRSAELNTGCTFHDIAPGRTASFVVRGAPELHLVSYLVRVKDQPMKPQYTLQLAFLADDGTVRERRVAALSVSADSAMPPLRDGSELCQGRVLRVLPPPGTAFVEVGSPEGRVLLRTDRLADSRAEEHEVVMRSGRQPMWFAPDELETVGTQRWTVLPVPDPVPTVKLPILPPRKESSEDDGGLRSTALMLGPNRALVFNVIGPGTMSITEKDGVDFAVEYLGQNGAGHGEVKDGHATLELPAGPSSVVLLPLGRHTGEVLVESRKLRPLDPSMSALEPASRTGSVWLADAGTPLRFPVYGPGTTPSPVRITAHALDTASPKPLRWRFVDTRGHELLKGELPIDETYDPYTAILRGGVAADLGMPSRTLLVPPPHAAVLEVMGVGLLVEADALVESGAQPDPMPPFDVELKPELRWVDVAVKAPRWLMLRPLAEQSARRHLFATLLRMPRIERLPPLPTGPWMAVEPEGSLKKAHVTEAARHLSPDQELQTLPLSEREVPIVVEKRGRNAGRIVLTCEVREALGGEIAMQVDGKPAASALVRSSTVRLEASATAGIHRVRVKGAARGRCTLAARTAPALKDDITVRRTVYQVPVRKSQALKLKLHTRPGQVVRVHYALYSEAPTPEAAFSVMVDNGSLQRKHGSSTALTTGKINQVMHLAGESVPTYGPQAKHALWPLGVAAVQLGDDLSTRSHRIKLHPLTPGHYWVRFFIEGRRHRTEIADSFITTEASAQAEGE